MTLREPIVECIYGWGKVMRLYDDHLDVNGASYALVELVSVHPIYHHIMGVSSARLELRFRHKKVVLRGIAAIENAQRVVAYLSERCTMHTVTDKHGIDSAPLLSPPHVDARVPGGDWRTEDLLAPSNERSSLLHSDRADHVQTTEEYRLEEHVRLSTTPIKIPRWQMIRQEQRARKLKRAQAESANREHGFDVEQLAVRLQTGLLPQVYVPTRLLAGEYAHYCTDATLCEEPLPGSAQRSYQVKDQGLLILTSRRMIYIGRKRQLVLGYSRLLHVSRLRGAIAVLSETWSKREIFEVRLPLECTMYLDAILLRFRQQEQYAHDNMKQAHVRHLYPDTNVYPYHARTTTTMQSETMTHQQPPGNFNPLKRGGKE